MPFRMSCDYSTISSGKRSPVSWRPRVLTCDVTRDSGRSQSRGAIGTSDVGSFCENIASGMGGTRAVG